ncbi:MAG TPA: hypothetical protein VKT83_19455 [bacterium]|nr:hypothetical protein [bacterium]
MKAVHVKVESVKTPPSNWAIGTPFIYQSSLWRINGTYLVTSRSGVREVWWILAERASDNWSAE